MNGYALIPLAAAVINLLAAVYVVALGTQTRLRRDYLALVVVISVWCLIDFLLWSGLTEEWSYAVIRAQILCWGPAGFLFLRFCYGLTDRKFDGFYYFFAALCLSAVTVGLTTPLIASGAHFTTWGVTRIAGPLNAVTVVSVVVVPAIWGILLLYRVQGELKATSAQRRLITTGLISTCVLGLTTNTIIPNLLEAPDTILLGSTATAIFSMFLFRAVVRYGFMKISVEQAASSVFETIQDGLLLLDSSQRCIHLNPAAVTILEVSEQSAIGRSLAEILPDCELSDLPGTASCVLEMNDELSKYLDMTHAPLSRDEITVGWVITVRDVTEIRRAEEALRQEKERFRNLAEGLPQVAFELDGDLKFTWVNKAGRELLGYSSPAEILRLSLKDILSRQEFNRALERWKRQNEGEDLEDLVYNVVRANGTTVPVLLYAQPQNQSGVLSGIYGIAIDISHRKKREDKLLEDKDKLELQLRQAQKMEAVGRLAGGVAHDFNNALSVILCSTTIAQEELTPEHPVYEDLEQVHAAGKRASKVIRQLLAFSRRQNLEMHVIDINDVVGDLEKMLRHLIREDVAFTTHLEPQLGSVEADASQVEQVLMNLVVNSLDAMPNGGRLSVSTKNIYLDETFVSSHPNATSGDYVMLEVSDTGEGMDEETLAHVFEPFYTTKEKGKGTGLGLATVYGIVRQHDGYIDVESKVGQGTRFSAYFPHTPHDPTYNTQVSERIIFPSQNKTVLLVEDDSGVRALTRSILERFGFHVVDAPGPREALDLVSNLSGNIDLLLTDVIMPGMNGRELHNALASEIGDVQVLYMSGYTDDVILPQGVREEGNHFLEKPFSRSELLRKVTEALSSRA